jgi:hypothetical protein
MSNFLRDDTALLATWLNTNGYLVCSKGTLAEIAQEAWRGDNYYYNNCTKPNYFLAGFMLRNETKATKVITDLLELLALDVEHPLYNKITDTYLTIKNKTDAIPHAQSQSIGALLVRYLKSTEIENPEIYLMDKIRSLLSFEEWKVGF